MSDLQRIGKKNGQISDPGEGGKQVKCKIIKFVWYPLLFFPQNLEKERYAAVKIQRNKIYH